MLYPPLGGSFDCTTAPGACKVVLSRSFIGAPDRIAVTLPTGTTGPAPAAVTMPSFTR